MFGMSNGRNQQLRRGGRTRTLPLCGAVGAGEQPAEILKQKTS